MDNANRIRKIVRRSFHSNIENDIVCEDKKNENNNIDRMKADINEQTRDDSILNLNQGDLDDAFYDDIALLSGATPWRTTATGHTLKLKVHSRDLIHPFKGIKKGARLKIEASNEKYGIFFDSECLLITWHDDPNNGETIQLKLDTVGGNHPFEIIETNDLFHLKVWLIADDETFVPIKKKFSERSPVKQSVIMCKVHEGFQRFCFVQRQFLEGSGGYLPIANPDVSEDFATATVKAFCGIVSRSELASDTIEGLIARRKWTTLLDSFNTWRS